MRFQVAFLFFSVYMYNNAETQLLSQKEISNEILNIVKNRQITPENAKKFLDNLKDIDWKEFATKEESVEMKILKLGGQLMSSFEQSFPVKSKKKDKKKLEHKKVDSEETDEENEEAVDEANCKHIVEDKNGVKYCATPLKQKDNEKDVEKASNQKEEEEEPKIEPKEEL